MVNSLWCKADSMEDKGWWKRKQITVEVQLTKSEKVLENILISQWNGWRMDVRKECFGSCFEQSEKTYVTECHRCLCSYANEKHEKGCLVQWWSEINSGWYL